MALSKVMSISPFPSPALAPGIAAVAIPQPLHQLSLGRVPVSMRSPCPVGKGLKVLGLGTEGLHLRRPDPQQTPLCMQETPTPPDRQGGSLPALAGRRAESAFCRT